MKVNEQGCEVFFPVNNHQCWLFEVAAVMIVRLSSVRTPLGFLRSARREGFEVHALIFGQRRSLGLPVNKTNVG